jgi:uncharacterized membrane protein (DUF485 family)
MPLIKCPECAGSASDSAATCPHCGFPIKPAPPAIPKRWWGYEWRSRQEMFGLPLVHVAIGWNPETGKLRIAKGVVAVGQFGIGFITIAQFGFGLVFGFGQFLAAPVAVAQFALGLFFGLGQFATGYIAIGQLAAGVYVLAQQGFGEHVWSAKISDPAALEFFRGLRDCIFGR